MLSQRFLNGFRVVELSTGIAGSYATKLFVDAGADVIKVEPASGDPVRRHSSTGFTPSNEDSALFSYLNAGKRSIIGEGNAEAVHSVIASADLVVRSLPDPWSDHGLALQTSPSCVHLTISPWGDVGPFVARPATDLTIQAEAGTVALHGHPDETPYQMGGRIVEWSAGTFGATASLAAMLRAKRNGLGEVVQVTLLATSLYISSVMMDSNHEMMGRPPIVSPARMVDLPSIEPTSDGFVGFKLYSRQQFESFALLIDRPDLLELESWAHAEYRAAHRGEWDAMVHAWTSSHTTEQVIAAATELRIPAANVNDAAGILDGYLGAHGRFVSSADGSFKQPAAPYVIEGVRPSPPLPAPALGEHNELVEKVSKQSVPHAEAVASETLPFGGYRVLDVTSHWAGPAVGQIFACLGADVIHVESATHMDGARSHVPAGLRERDRWWEWSGSWHSKSSNKRSLCIDLTTDDGQAILAELVAKADVLVENFSPRVFDRFGFTQERVFDINPRIVFARMPAFGLAGDWRERTGFAQTMEQVSGMAWLTGHPSSPPRILNGPCDPLAGYHTAFAIMSALRDRDHTGKGSFIEAAMVESALNVSAELTIERSAYGRTLQRMGNRSPDCAPQGVYPSAGDDEWVALSVTTIAEWKSLCEVLDAPGWMRHPALEITKERSEAQDRVDPIIAQWTSSRSSQEIVDILTRVDIPVGIVRDPRLQMEHPQLSAIGYYEQIEHPLVGSRTLPTLPFSYASVDRWYKRPAPLLGEHNVEILSTVLGASQDRIGALQEAGIIADWPTGIPRS